MDWGDWERLLRERGVVITARAANLTPASLR